MRGKRKAVGNSRVSAEKMKGTAGVRRKIKAQQGKCEEK